MNAGNRQGDSPGTIAVLFLGLSLIFTDLPGFPQGLPSALLENTVEIMAAGSPSEADHPEWIAELASLVDQPVNLNNCSTGDLQKIPFLSGRQIGNLQNYLLNYGSLVSVYELTAVEGFDSALIRRILPYVTVGSGPEEHPLRLKKIFSQGRGGILFRYQQVLQEQEGYHVADSVLELNPSAGYLGDPRKYYFRADFHYDDRIHAGISGEKDAGEQFFRGTQKYGMDFYAGYFQLKNTGFLKNLVIGNFRADFGQGLTLGGGFSTAILAGTATLQRFPGGIRPTLSANESSYLRGMAAVLRFRDFGISLFCSRHRRDARISGTDTATGSPVSVSALPETGYHRLPSETAVKNILTEIVAGGNLSWRNRFMSIGFTGFYTRWSLDYRPEPVPYKRFAFTGKENLNLGTDFRVRAGPVTLFGEFSRSRNGGMACLAGIEVVAGPAVTFSAIWRDYGRNYQDLLSNAVGRNSPNANEKGILLVARIQALSNITLSGYADLCYFPWLKYRVDLPSRGTHFLLRADYFPGRTLFMYLQFRSSTSQFNRQESGLPLNRWVNGRSYSVRYQMDWQVTPSLLLKSRFEMTANSSEQEETRYGYVIFQDILFRPEQFPLSFSFRYSLFDTDSYAERIYTYENDVRFGYSVPALEGRGIRCYLLVSLKLSRRLDLSARYAQTWYADREVIGTGLDRISGNLGSELKIQAGYRF